MVENLLEQLKKVSVVVADTGEIHAIREFRPQDATTNPTLIAQAAAMPEYAPLLDEAFAWARKSVPEAAVVQAAMDRLSVAFGLEILRIVPGRVSTEVDARLSYDTPGTIAKARSLIAQYEQARIPRERILIKIASTWEGIEAARVLEREGIRCNMTLIFGLHQAIACAEAGAQLISPFVGRILDWHKAATGRDSFLADEDPGVLSVRKIYTHYKQYGHKTEIMGASFRNSEEILALAGIDLLTIAPKFLAELQGRNGTLERKLSPDMVEQVRTRREPMDRAAFDAAHREDRAAFELLERGIQQFVEAGQKLESILLEKSRGGR